MLKGHQLRNGTKNGLKNGVIYAGMGDKCAACIDLLRMGQYVAHVFLQATIQFAAIQFAHAHATAVIWMHLYAGLDMQHIHTQFCNGRAPAAGVHKFQRIQQETGLGLLR